MKQPKQQGFTLIELLIAMMIAAIIAVMSYQAIQQVVSVKTQTDSHSEGFDGLQKAIWWLEQDLAQMAPRPIQDQLGSSLPALQLTLDQGVQWTRFAAYPTASGQAGLVRVGYVLEEGKLYRLIWPVVDRAQDTEVQKWLLLSGVEGFTIKLLNRDNKWQTLWPEVEQAATDLPKLTELLLRVKGLGEVRRLIVGVDGMPPQENNQQEGNGG